MIPPTVHVVIPDTQVIQGTLLNLPQSHKTSDDYYTPKWLFDQLDITFDIDVCAPEGGIPWVPATRYFAMSDNGLTQPWSGCVWMNPPYSDVEPWWGRFRSHRHGIALLPMAKSLWLDDVWDTADGVAIPRGGGRIYFHRSDRPKPMEIWFPVFLAAFGDECVEAIRRVGPVR